MSSGHFELLKPDSTLLSTGYNVEFGGGAANPSTHHAALADELPTATKVTGVPWTRIFDVSSVAGGDYRCTFGTYTLEANERCRRVRWEAIADMRAARFRVGLGNGATTAEPLGRGEFRPLPNGVGKVQSVVGPWATKAQDGAGLATLEWTQTNLNDLRARFTPVAAHFLGTAYFYKLRVKLDIAEKAEPFFITPFLDEVFPNTTPTLKWDEGSSDAQKKVEVKLFPADVAEDDSFNIATATNQIYLYKATTTGLQHRVAAGFLQHGVRYYAFVRVATDFNGQDWWSNWSEGIAFKINAKPTVTVIGPVSPVVDTAKPVITWDFDDEEGDLQSGARIIVIEKTTLTWPGFVDPEELSAANDPSVIYDSGLISSEALDHELPVALQNDKSYRAYVKVRQRIPSVLDSDYSYIGFDTAFASPLIPLLAAQDIQVATAIDLTVIPSLSNLLSADTSSLEGSIGAWTGGTNTTISRSNTQALHGTWSLGVTRNTSTGTAEFYSDLAANACTPCTFGQRISASAWVKAGATPRSATIAIQFIDNSSAVIDTALGTTVTDSTTAWQRVDATAIVPSGAVKCRIRGQVLSVAVAENHFFDQMMIYSGSASPLIPWDLGGGTLGATIGPVSSFRTFNKNWLTDQQASIESTIGGTGWSAWNAGAVNTRSTTVAKNGTASLRLERSGSTGDSQHTQTANVGERIPTKYGDEWTFIASFRAGTTGRTCFINLVFRDIDNNIIPNLPYLDDAQNFAVDNNAGWITIKIRGTAPPDSYEMEATVTVQALPVGEFHYVDEMILYKGDTNTWSRGDGKSFAFATGDHSLRVTTAQLDWLPEEEIVLADVWDYEDDRNCSVRLVLQTDGKIRYEWSTDGTSGLKKTATSTAAMSVVAAGVKRTIRVDFDNDNGAAGQNVSFFEGPDKNNATTAIGTNPVTVATVNAPFNGFGQLEIGGKGFDTGGWQGYAYDVTMYDDLVQSSDMAEAVFQYPGVAEFLDSGRLFGRLWQPNGDAEIEMKEEPNPDYFLIERSRDNGTTWEIFRYNEGLLSDSLPKTFEPFTVRDHEVPLYEDVKYRASAGYTGLGYQANSPWSAIVTEQVAGNYVTLKSTMDPTLNRHFRVAENWLAFKRIRNRAMFQAVGRRNPIVIRGSGGADAFSILFTLIEQTEFDAMEALLNKDGLLFVQTPKGSWWAEIATDLNFRAHLWDRLRSEQDAWQVDIPFQEVDRLDGDSVAG